ncbi:MAG: ABC transporter permease [Bacteroidales bacterium]|jgi:ABC-type transport system involved in multi-copper enzyme maturation permease subunit|nr:ABC transporter permease [Bacteroidales bacterium]
MNFPFLFKKEILDNLYNFRYGIILALSVLVIGTSIFTMYRDYCSRVENYLVLRPEGKEATAIIPPTPLSVFVKGLDENLCRSYEIDFLGISMGSSQQAVNRLFKLFTTPDLLYIIKIVLSLCAILMAYDMITREKENGTLKLILSNPVKRPALLFAKWLGGFTSFIVPILIVCLFSIAVVSLLPMVQFTWADYGKIGTFILTSILYLGIFFTLGLFISCLTARSVTSLILSLFFWTMIVFVVPNLGNSLSKQIIKTKSIEQLQFQQNMAWRKAVFNKVNNKSEGKMDFGWEQLTMAFQIEQNKQIKISETIAKCSPSGIFTLVASNIMGTGIDDQNRLKNHVWEYYNTVKDAPSDSDGNLTGDFPVFSYQRTKLTEVLSQNITSYAILLFFIALLFTGAYAFFMKYDLR